MLDKLRKLMDEQWEEADFPQSFVMREQDDDVPDEPQLPEPATPVDLPDAKAPEPAAPVDLPEVKDPVPDAEVPEQTTVALAGETPPEPPEAAAVAPQDVDEQAGVAVDPPPEMPLPESAETPVGEVGEEAAPVEPPDEMPVQDAPEVPVGEIGDAETQVEPVAAPDLPPEAEVPVGELGGELPPIEHPAELDGVENAVPEARTVEEPDTEFDRWLQEIGNAPIERSDMAVPAGDGLQYDQMAGMSARAVL